MNGGYEPEARVPDERALTGWQPPPLPPREALSGRWCRVEPLDAGTHASDLHAANVADGEGHMWRYLAYGPFTTLDAYRRWVAEKQQSADPLFFAIFDTEHGCASGVASWLRIDAPNGVLEVGHLAYSPRLQRTRAATEAMYLMMRRAFALGYRRYEWKCNAANAASRAAALRLGFRFEGVFRQHMVVKGRNRDTAWYSITDGDWPTVRAGFECWLAPENFDAEGRQKRSLAACRAPGPAA